MTQMQNHIAASYSAIAAPDWNTIDAVTLTEKPTLQDGLMLHCKTSAGDLIFSLSDYGMRLRSAESRVQEYDLLQGVPQPSALSVKQDDNATTVIAESLRLVIQHQPFSFELTNSNGEHYLRSPSDGHFVRKHRVPPLAKTDRGWWVSLDLKSSEPIYGLGEKWSALNKRGQLLRSYNSDALGVNAEISYKNIPFCWSPEGWGMLCHTPAPVTHAVGHAAWSQRTYTALIEDPCLDVFFFTSRDANKGADIIRQLTDLTGRASVPPQFSGGVILSKAYYQDADELLAVAREVREREMPCDVITIDGRAWQDTRTRFAFEWDATRYPDPAVVMQQLKDLNFKVCVWEYPLISVEHDWFNMFAEKGWLLSDKRTGQAYQYDWDKQAFGGVLTALPRSGIVDFTHPEAYAFWRDAHKPLFDLGVDMIKADFGEQIEDDNMLAHNGESGHALHNVYAHLYNRCVYEAAEMYGLSGPFLFSRASWIGCQRFNSQWVGDPQADWEGMMGNIRGGLSWGLSGAPFYATDVGGFYKDTRDDALYVRWAQAAIFSAHFRLHGIGPREPWSYSEQANHAVSKALQLRYRLQTYLQNCFDQASTQGTPVQRAMVLAFPKEKQSWAFENQFMFGDDLLVVPCFDPSGDIEFYLPEGEWVLFDPDAEFSATVFSGLRVRQMNLELDQIAVFTRVGSQIPLSKAVQYTDQYGGSIDVESVWSAKLT